ncbi:putative relaxase/mobilization nuclease MobA [Pseudomonas syringae pv. actinidiae ICMP 19103]|nr:putative relaxase/mobilization nuclease MobA [Pseudomonas syringae pv. actinidiae ICMP 19103]
MARYDVIEKDHRQYYGYDEPEVSTRSPARHDPVDDVPDDDKMYDRVLRRGTFC